MTGFSGGLRLHHDETDNCRRNWEAYGPLWLVAADKTDRWALEAYCVKCRAKRYMREPRSVTLKNGFPSATGYCPVCDTKMFRFGKWLIPDEKGTGRRRPERRDKPWAVL